MPPSHTLSKLGLSSRIGGAFLFALTAWAVSRYGLDLTTPGVVRALLLAALVLALPDAAAYAKYALFRFRDHLAEWRSDSESGSFYVSRSPVDDPDAALDRVRDALGSVEAYDEVVRDEFSTGPGLTVVHSTYHTLSVRLDGADRVVVTGDSERLDGLVERVEGALGVSLRPTRVDPFADVTPVRGGPRAALGAVLAFCLVVGVVAVSGAAYPSGAFNDAEKTVLVTHDLRADADPTVTQEQARLAKAAFLTGVLDEAAVEIRMVNTTGERRLYAASALETSDAARRLLRSARESSLSQSQADRADRIESSLYERERELAAALRETATGPSSAGDGRLHEIAAEFRERANASVAGA